MSQPSDALAPWDYWDCDEACMKRAVEQKKRGNRSSGAPLPTILLLAVMAILLLYWRFFKG